MDRTKRTEQERIEILKKVKALLKEGMTKTQAFKECGVYASIYRQWMDKYGNENKSQKRSKPRLINIPENVIPAKSDRKLMVLIGDVDTVLETIRGL